MMGRQFISEPINLFANTAVNPVRKMVSMFLAITLIPLLTLGVQLSASGDAAGTLVVCERSSSYLNATCGTWQTFVTTVTDPTSGDVTEAMSLTNALPGRCAPNTSRNTLAFYADLSPCILLASQTSHTELCKNIRVTTFLSTATSPTPSTTYPRISIQRNRIHVHQVSSVSVQT